MAGTIFGIPLSQRVDLNGLPSVGWRLYLYQANTSTPVQSYQDTALTLLNPWPIVADAYGMLPQFWLADGNYRARATSADGSLTYFDQLSILALGASSGAAPSGGVDATTIYQTGDLLWLDRSGTRVGWVRDNGRTLGSATSGAAERANADAQPLFEFLWNNFSNTICPVVSGRGASSVADWTANKQITLPDKRGCSAVGADVMGNTSSGRFTNVPVVSGAIDTPGSIVGENNHTLQDYELASHNHDGGGTTDDENQNHTHSQIASTSNGSYSGGGSNGPLGNGSQTGVNNRGHTHTFGFTTNDAGDDAPHNIMQLSVIGTFYRKL